MTSESQKFNHQVALLCSNNYSSSSSNDSFSPIQDTSFSSFTDLYESQGKIDVSDWSMTTTDFQTYNHGFPDHELAS